MAEKRSKSILGGLKKMLHLDSENPSKPVPKTAASARKRSQAAEKSVTSPENAKEQAPAVADPEAAPKPDKKKVQNQPWYRHRQRW